MFFSLEPRPSDPLLSLIKAYQDDSRPSKIDLGVGVYRNDAGETPVFEAVKLAESVLWHSQRSKAYLGPEGDIEFVDRVADLATGVRPLSVFSTGIQTPGGTGALRVLVELWQRANPDGVVWLGVPSWPVHETMLRRLGCQIRTYSHYDPIRQHLARDELLAAAAATKSGDLFLLHGCCHNPTGADLDAEAWQEIGRSLERAGTVPLVDFAYHGLGNGLENDTLGVRILLNSVPELLLAYSCDKNFGLYRDRVGAAYVFSTNQSNLANVPTHFAEIARSLWSMPPDHGAAIVRLILADPKLRGAWQNEIESMRLRIKHIRHRLADAGTVGCSNLERLVDEKGMFAMLPIDREVIDQLRLDHGVYMASNGRINIAGLTEAMCDDFLRALQQTSIVGSRAGIGVK